MDNKHYGYRADGSIWLDRIWASDQLVDKYNMQITDMSEDQLTEEYVNKFGDPNRP